MAEPCPWARVLRITIILSSILFILSWTALFVAAIWARRLSCLLFASSRLLLRFSKVLLMFRPWVPDPGTKKATRIPGTHKPGVYPGSSLVPQNLSRWLTTSGCRQCGRKYMGHGYLGQGGKAAQLEQFIYKLMGQLAEQRPVLSCR